MTEIILSVNGQKGTFAVLNNEGFMKRIGLIREGKIPADNRVALTPAQCKWLLKNSSDIQIVVQHSPDRCFSDREYLSAGAELKDDLSDCDILFGIKEVPVSQLIPGKTYLFFSHTKKKQPHNQPLIRAVMDQQITLIDYECLEHEDGQRIIGFGFFAGIVGAHNGMMAYGSRTGLYSLDRVYKQRSFRELIHNYFGLRLPNVKIAVTGSGRVAHGILEIMNLMGIHEVENDDYLRRRFAYPVYTQIKGADLYGHKLTGSYNRIDFHEHPEEYSCKFLPYAAQTDILMNGVYWDKMFPGFLKKKMPVRMNLSYRPLLISPMMRMVQYPSTSGINPLLIRCMELIRRPWRKPHRTCPVRSI